MIPGMDYIMDLIGLGDSPQPAGSGQANAYGQSRGNVVQEIQIHSNPPLPRRYMDQCERIVSNDPQYRGGVDICPIGVSTISRR